MVTFMENATAEILWVAPVNLRCQYAPTLEVGNWMTSLTSEISATVPIGLGSECAPTLDVVNLTTSLPTESLDCT